ncbi:hypothetical protein KC852_02755 [Candidatus Nomurabacteria bacterium]|nr:hypothetical protein [Candidatus Nomurabacteria bacterium]
METRNCQNCKHDFVIEAEDFAFYEKIQVPPPTFCPECRRIRRLTWRNDFTLYSRMCDLCSNSFVSIYNPTSSHTIYCPKCFHSDKWNPSDYAMDYDPARSFIDQVLELYEKTPVLGIINDNDIASVNCLYGNDLAFSKNCAMVFIAWRLENVYNSVSLAEGDNLSDALLIAEKSSYSYDLVYANNVSRCKSVFWCDSCVDCCFCFDCRGCQDCFMSSGLRNKRYCFQNQQYSKDEYENIMNSYALHTRTGYARAKKEFKDFLKDKPRKFAELRNCVDCTGSDSIRSKNVKDSMFASFSEDSRYVHNGVSFKACYDCEVGGETELAYECITPDHSNKSLCTIESWKNSDIGYAIDCHSCQSVFGCISLKNGQYSILNKKYSKEEYNALKDIIIADMKKRGEYGEFFPSRKSPFGINETRANNYLSLSKEEAIQNGYKWQDSTQHTTGMETLSHEQVPDSIEDIQESFTSEILSCLECSRNYRILAGELTLHKQLRIPIPEKCFFCRNEEREKMRGGYLLFQKQCDCVISSHDHHGQCQNIFKTVFDKNEKRPIYCESCYQKEMI